MAQIFNISSSAQFLDALALGLIERFPNLADVTVFLPSKRAILGLQKALAQHSSGAAILLPKIEALGDVDEDEFVLRGFPHIERLPPAISQNGRLLKVTKMILAQDTEKKLNSSQALHIAHQLCLLLDEFYNRNADFDILTDIVPDGFSEHWTKTLDFLDVVMHKWQAYKRENGFLDEVERRNLLLQEVAKYWREFPPQKPIVIAGTTATIPATQELIASICSSEQGWLVLFGLDANLNSVDSTALEPTHPQFNLTQLLTNLGNPQIAIWSKEKNTSRQKLLSTALLPKWRVDEWQTYISTQENLELIECKNSEEEASIIAMVLRENYEISNEKAALVTTNKSLARRVQGKLSAWGIEVSNSHSASLAESDLGQFLLLLAEFLASKQQPVKALALFKHLFVPIEIRQKIYNIEKELLRGLRPEDFCISEHLVLKNFFTVKEIFNKEYVDFLTALKAILLLAEEISNSVIWSESEPRAVELLHDLQKEIDEFGEVEPILIPDLLSKLFSIQSLGFAKVTDSKIEILSLIESRFCDANLLIMSGLNEGSFPQISNNSDLLNQQMRRQLGLDLPERKIGQQAHDFELLSQAPRVVYTRAKKEAGAPTVKSRFLQALTSLIKIPKGEKYTKWLEQMRSVESVTPCLQPMPKPPVCSRPQELAVTKIEQLMRDPYVVYAQKILGIYKLDDIDKDITPADFGDFVHKALEKYNEVYDGTLETLLQCAEEILQTKYSNRNVLRVFWLPRFRKIAEWILLKERESRGAGKQILSEYKSQIVIDGFCITARADRLEKSASGVKIIDYKTGAVPSDKDVKLGVSPQVSLEALIFSHEFELPIEACEFWQTKGLDDDKIHVVNVEMEHLIEEAYSGVSNLIAKFADENTPYIARPRPQIALKYNDYAHLARIQEWE